MTSFAPDAERLLTTAQAAEVLNVPVGTLRWWRHAKTGPRSFALGPRMVRYRHSDLVAWLEEQYAAGTATA